MITLLAGERIGTGSTFDRIATSLVPGADGAELLDLLVDCDQAPVVEWLHPFSWDAAERGVVVRRRTLAAGDPLRLLSGPYATAGAAADLAGRRWRPPDLPDDQAHRYRDPAWPEPT